MAAGPNALRGFETLGYLFYIGMLNLCSDHDLKSNIQVSLLMGPPSKFWPKGVTAYSLGPYCKLRQSRPASACPSNADNRCTCCDYCRRDCALDVKDSQLKRS